MNVRAKMPWHYPYARHASPSFRFQRPDLLISCLLRHAVLSKARRLKKAEGRGGERRGGEGQLEEAELQGKGQKGIGVGLCDGTGSGNQSVAWQLPRGLAVLMKQGFGKSALSQLKKANRSKLLATRMPSATYTHWGSAVKHYTKTGRLPHYSPKKLQQQSIWKTF